MLPANLPSLIIYFRPEQFHGVEPNKDWAHGHSELLCDLPGRNGVDPLSLAAATAASTMVSF